jgi:hypothetical protein
VIEEWFSHLRVAQENGRDVEEDWTPEASSRMVLEEYLDAIPKSRIFSGKARLLLRPLSRSGTARSSRNVVRSPPFRPS